VIDVDDPTTEDVRALLEEHLRFSHAVTPAGFAFALDVEQLCEPGVTFFTARRAGSLVGVGALKRLDERHAELKSMHTRASERGHGVGQAMVEHILAFATQEGYHRVSLESGTMGAFAPARALYAKLGFQPCEPFGAYVPSPHNTWMTLRLDAAQRDQPF
jgi:putative acetyltransferase